MKNTILLFLLFSSLFLTAQTEKNEYFIEKSFVIIGSTSDYKEAVSIAEKASRNMQIPQNNRGNYYSQTLGLDNEEVCGCGEKHGYMPRGRYDDGEYISIEYSDAFDGFAQNLYVVMSASGMPNSELIQKAKVAASNHIPDAYTKNANVYIGCIH